MTAVPPPPACANAGDDAKHAKRPANREITVKKKTKVYCHSCWWELTAPDREKAAAKAKAGAEKLRAACVDCRAAGRPLDRPAPHPGPRCASDWRVAKKAARRRQAATRIERVYSLTPEAHAAILAAQGGACAWPGCRANGATKPLRVDHDHSCCDGPTSCGRCVRGLLCANHNTLLGPPGVPQSVTTVGDDPEVWRGVIRYLTDPPARAVLLALDGEPMADRVAALLAEHDGSRASAVSILSGLSRDELDALGGVSEEAS